MKRIATVLGLALLLLGPLGVGSAAGPPLAGSLDPSFGNDGVVVGAAGTIALQPDGKIVVASNTPTAARSGYAILLSRYQQDGALDPSFGNGGRIRTPFEYWVAARAVAVQPDGKIVVAGSSFEGDDNVDSEFTLARYDSDGSLDTSFGTNGVVNTVIPGQSWDGAEAESVATLPDGDIVAGGTAWDSDPFSPGATFVLAAYRPDGSLDPSFGQAGIVETSFDLTNLRGIDELVGIAVQRDGTIVAAGTSLGDGRATNGSAISVARYEPDGSLDQSFGSGGEVTTPHPGPNYTSTAVTLQGAKIVVAGLTGRSYPVVARFGADGSLDPTFGKAGFAQFKARRLFYPEVAAQSDGKLIVAFGSHLLRLNQNGRLDPSFGLNGVAQVGGRVSNLAVQRDGKILVAGASLARLLGGNNCAVPALRGRTIARATRWLMGSYCQRGRIARSFSSRVRRGRVISTHPPAGDRLPAGGAVELVVSRGKRQ